MSLALAMPRDRGPFRVGERVLVPHTDKFYVAKVPVLPLECRCCIAADSHVWHHPCLLSCRR